MTTVVAVKCIDGFVMGSDSQLSIGTRAKEIGIDKIYNIKNILIAYAGDYNYFERLKDDVSERVKDKINSPQELIEIFESCTKNLFNKYPITEDNYTQIIFGTAIDQAIYLHRIDSLNCFSIKINDYYTIGSGSIFAQYVLKRLWTPQINRMDAKCTLAYVISETTGIDQASGAPVNMAELGVSGFIRFMERDFIDRIINAISKIDKYFTYYFKKFICNPSSMEFSKDGIKIKETGQPGQ